MAVKECCFCVSTTHNKKSIFPTLMRFHLIYFIFISFLFVKFSLAADADTCSNVKNIFEKKGMLSSIDWQEHPNSDADELCSTPGCCGAASRSRLTQLARSQFEGSLRAELTRTADHLAARARRFDELFRKLLQQSREDFHAMFKRTYGMIYEQHSYVFEQLFEQLERYYSRGDSDFDSMMDGFFGILYQKMFTVLNSQYTFDEKYLRCVGSQMREAQPFEDAPHKLSVQLRRAFVATRTFYKAARAGADALRAAIQIPISSECWSWWARLRYCGWCSGLAPPPCSRYCHNVARACLPAHLDLADSWDTYLDALEKVADRLLGPFNIAMVVESIDIKISEAIMSFQEHNQEISQKIFSGCGKPVLGGGGPNGPFFTPGRSRRSADDEVYDYDDFEFEGSMEHLKEGRSRTAREIRQLTAAGRSRHSAAGERFRRGAAPDPAVNFKAYQLEGRNKKRKPAAAKSDDAQQGSSGSLERVIRESRGAARAARGYWPRLPAALCAPLSVTSPPCFNRTHVASYNLPAATAGSSALTSNPEARGAGTAVAGAGAARAQADGLRALTARLKDAYNGLEVRWIDDGEPQAAGSAPLALAEPEGSGSGSGDYDEGPPDDDEDGRQPLDYSEGSGYSPPSIDVSTARSTESPRPASEPAFVPSIVQGPSSNNVNMRARTEDEPQSDPNTPNLDPSPNLDTDTAGLDTNVAPVDSNSPRLDPSPVAGAAGKLSLPKALFLYTVPVVYTWFGSMVLDLF